MRGVRHGQFAFSSVVERGAALDGARKRQYRNGPRIIK